MFLTHTSFHLDFGPPFRHRRGRPMGDSPAPHPYSSREGYAWAEDKEHCEEYGRMLNANPAKV